MLVEAEMATATLTIQPTVQDIAVGALGAVAHGVRNFRNFRNGSTKKAVFF